jgi:photosystem II stability/assembly factor-like uncharacterized protein
MTHPRLALLAAVAALALLVAACTPSGPPTPPGEPPRTALQTTPTAGTPLVPPAPVATPAEPRITPLAAPTATRAPARATPATTAPTPMPGGWQRLGPVGEDLLAVAADPTRPGTIYAGGARLLTSVDGGRAWQPLRDVRGLRGLSVVNGALFVAASDGCARGTTAPALRSDDGGQTWRELGPNLRALAVRPDGRALYAAGCPGILRSDDGGQVWQRVASPSGVEGFAVALSPAQPDIVWAAFVSEGGSVQLQRSGDGGRTWSQRAAPGDLWAPVILAPHPQQVETLAMATRTGAWQTTDGGATWAPLEAGLETARREEAGMRLYDFTAALALPDRLVLATAASGIYLRRDGAAAFTRLPGALPPTRDLAFQAGPAPALLAATADGVYSLALP